MLQSMKLVDLRDEARAGRSGRKEGNRESVVVVTDSRESVKWMGRPGVGTAAA